MGSKVAPELSRLLEATSHTRREGTSRQGCSQYPEEARRHNAEETVRGEAKSEDSTFELNNLRLSDLDG